MPVNFNDYKEEYLEGLRKSISFIGQDVNFFTKIKANRLIGLAKKYFGDLSKLTALDVGCGIGLTDHFLTHRFSELHGVDIAGSVLKKAAQENPEAFYQMYNGKKLPFSDDNFDLVFSICVMEYLPPAEWGNFLGEMCRVTKKGGLLMIFQHNPYNPLTRLVLNRCPYDENHYQISKGTMRKLFREKNIPLVDHRYILFFPWQGWVFRRMENRLGMIPLGAQYYVAGRKPTISKNRG